MFDWLRRGLRRFKDAVRSRFRRHTPTPTPIQPQEIGSATPATTSPTPRPPPSLLEVPTTVPTVVVPPDPEPQNIAQNPDPALTSPAPSTRERSVRNTTWAGFKTLLGVLEEGSNAFGPLKEAVGGLARCIEIVEQEAMAREDYKKLRGELEVLFNDLAGFLGGSTPPTMTPIIENISK